MVEVLAEVVDVSTKPIDNAMPYLLGIGSDEKTKKAIAEEWIKAKVVSAASLSEFGLDYTLGFKDDQFVFQPDITITPHRFMYAKTGSDDAPIFTAMFTYLRNLVTTDSMVRARVDMNGLWNLETPVNATGIHAWNVEVAGGYFYCETTDEFPFDTAGTRGVFWHGVSFCGDKINMPRAPMLNARATSSGDGFCDNNLFLRCVSVGYWSVAAWFAYAQETTTHLHGRYWNYNHDAHIVLLEGYDSHPQTSTFKTLKTGGQSFINCKYINCDMRYLPVSKTAAITGITKAASAVVTCAGGHPFVNGDVVILATVTGMIEMNARKAVISGVTATTFVMTGINSTGFSTFTNGVHTGTAVKAATKPAMYMNRMEQHSFDTCYVVAYGDHAIEFGFPDHRMQQSNTFDFLIEGAQAASPILFTVDTTNEILRDVVFKSYNTHSLTDFFTTNASGGGQVTFYDGSIKVASHTYNSLDMATPANRFAFYGTDVFWPARAGVTPTAYAAFVGQVSAIDDGDVEVWGHTFRNTESMALKDGITAPATIAGQAIIYVDAADGDLKIKFGDGTVKTIVVDT